MTTEVVDHPLVNTFEENGIKVVKYLREDANRYALIVFDGDQSTADRGIDLVRNSDAELRALRYARYFGDDGTEVIANWELLFRGRTD